MRLVSIDFEEFLGEPREWTISELTLGRVNLVVGKNASGKSRTLSVIHTLAQLLHGSKKPAELMSGTYRTTFEHKGRVLNYNLDIKEMKVVSEEFRDAGTVLLKRGPGGIGTIFHEKENKHLEFQTPESDAAAVARLDTIQHSFLVPLNEWGEGVRKYHFGGLMGHNSVAVIVANGPEPDPRNGDVVIPLFRRGMKKFPEQFINEVKKDMHEIGYLIDDVGTMGLPAFRFQMPVGSEVEPLMLFVQERDLATKTEQMFMSQGMFRALSVIIHIAYATLVSRPSCIIVDDIGEGLDFDRSCKLINLIRERALHSDIQIILSTNDRFVMNEVPLDEWSILQRQGSHVRVRNRANSEAEFERFRYVGMSNFTFFEMDFIDGQPALEEAVAQ